MVEFVIVSDGVPVGFFQEREDAVAALKFVSGMIEERGVENGKG